MMITINTAQDESVDHMGLINSQQKTVANHIIKCNKTNTIIDFSINGCAEKIALYYNGPQHRTK